MAGWELIETVTATIGTTTSVPWGPEWIRGDFSEFLVGVDDTGGAQNLTITITGGVIKADTNTVYFMHDGLKYTDGTTAVNTITFKNDVKLLWTPRTWPVMAITAVKAAGSASVTFYIYGKR
jgi:hypothetical protein